jgi:hypothetical protein
MLETFINLFIQVPATTANSQTEIEEETTSNFKQKMEQKTFMLLGIRLCTSSKDGKRSL